MQAPSLVLSVMGKTVCPLSMEVFQRQTRAKALVHGYPKELEGKSAELPCCLCEDQGILRMVSVAQ